MKIAFLSMRPHWLKGIYSKDTLQSKPENNSMQIQGTHACWSMARSVHDTRGQASKLKAFSIGKQLVKLRAVPLKGFTQVEDTRKDFLNFPNILPNRNLATQLRLNVGCSRQVVSMSMGLQNPFDFESILLNEVLIIIWCSSVESTA